MSAVAAALVGFFGLIALVMVYRRIRLWWWERHLRGWSPEGIAALDSMIDGPVKVEEIGVHSIVVAEPFKSGDEVRAYLKAHAEKRAVK